MILRMDGFQPHRFPTELQEAGLEQPQRGATSGCPIWALDDSVRHTLPLRGVRRPVPTVPSYSRSLVLREKTTHTYSYCVLYSYDSDRFTTACKPAIVLQLRRGEACAEDGLRHPAMVASSPASQKPPSSTKQPKSGVWTELEPCNF